MDARACLDDATWRSKRTDLEVIMPATHRHEADHRLTDFPARRTQHGAGQVSARGDLGPSAPTPARPLR